MSGAAEATATANSRGDLVKFFSGHAPFEALNAAHWWCRQHNLSYGAHERGEPEGLLFGSWSIAKWRNLTTRQRMALHGEINGGREGPVYVVIYAAHRHLIPEAEQ